MFGSVSAVDRMVRSRTCHVHSAEGSLGFNLGGNLLKLHPIRTWSVLLPFTLVLAFALVACGGNDAGTGAGSDEQYVATICKASLKLTDAIAKASSDPSKVKNADDAVKLLSEPFQQYLNDLKGANPPKDVKDYHDQTVKAVSDSLEKLKKDKNPSALSSGDQPQPSQTIKDRLSRVADSNEDCKKAGFSF